MEVEFWIKYHTYWGESLRVVGSCASLGSWSPSRAPRMEWQGGGMWRLRAAVPRAAGLVEYKYLVAEHDTGNARSWQGGGNAVLAVGAAEAQLQVYDSWGGEPGAPVLQKGLKPTTKEASLLAWAAAAEKRVFAGSAELRAARAELQAAREVRVESVLHDLAKPKSHFSMISSGSIISPCPVQTAQRAQKEVERLTLALEASEEAKRELQARLDAATRQLEAQSHTSSSAPPAPPTSAASPARALVGELTFGSAPHGSSPGLPVRAQHERQSLVPGRVLGKAL